MCVAVCVIRSWLYFQEATIFEAVHISMARAPQLSDPHFTHITTYPAFASSTSYNRVRRITSAPWRSPCEYPFGNRDVIWRVRSVTDNGWHYAHTEIPDGLFRLVFEINGNKIRGGLDDISVTEGFCPLYSTCQAWILKLTIYSNMRRG